MANSNITPALGSIRLTRLFPRALILLLVAGVLVLLCAPSTLWASQPSQSVSASSQPLAGAQSPAAGSNAAQQDTTLTLDNVTITIHTPLAPPSPFVVAEPGDASQSADSSGLKPFREFQIVAVPFGTKAGIESLPMARAGGQAQYEAGLRAYRQSQGAQSLPGPSATLFSQRVGGEANFIQIDLSLDGKPRPVLIVEWVVQAGKRLWIVRIGHELAAGTPGQNDASALLSLLGGLVIHSDTLDRPTTIAPDVTGLPQPAPSKNPEAHQPNGDLPFPPWWNGKDCDYNNYFGQTGLTPFILGNGGAVYRNMEACGPRPIGDHAPNAVAWFYKGSMVPELEWQCVELSMRFLYLAYDVNPYPNPGGGKDVVPNYSKYYPSGSLETIANGTPNKAPQPDDVISFGYLDTVGHTAVVTGSKVYPNGSGTIQIIDENALASGRETLNVVNWSVRFGKGYTVGWLHKSTSITEYPIPTANSEALGITAGPDGNLWFTEYTSNQIARITTGGAITEFPIPTPNGGPWGITAGPDGNLWFTEFYGNQIGRITTGGAFAEFPLPIPSSEPYGITAGPDGNLWFTEFYGNQIGRLSP